MSAMCEVCGKPIEHVWSHSLGKGYWLHRPPYDAFKSPHAPMPREWSDSNWPGRDQ